MKLVIEQLDIIWCLLLGYWNFMPQADLTGKFMNNARTTENEKYHLFAWQGFSYEIPLDWNLAEYSITDGVSCVRFQDDFGPRLEFEWIYARRPIKAEIIRRRYDKVADAMGKAGAVTDNIEELPEGWAACLYSIPDGRRLLAAFRLVQENIFFCLLKIHFASASKREGERIIRQIASTFRLYRQGLVPWAIYDIIFQLHADFRLVATSFLAGSKLMVFEWRGRRLYLFFFSFADILRQKQPIEKWCAGYLNGFKAVSGVKFTAGEEGKIIARRKWLRFWGSVEPITRWCLHYKAWCKLREEENQLFLGVLNYRHPEDIVFLSANLDSSLLPNPD